MLSPPKDFSVAQAVSLSLSLDPRIHVELQIHGKLMMQTALVLHLLGTIVWVGGMFFAHMALRPAANELLEPAQRLPLLYRTLSGFFPWVWASMVLILGSGYWIFLGLWAGQAGLYVHLMQGIGLIMVGVFVYIYFLPFRKMGQALAKGNFPLAGTRMALIRQLIGTNLILGLIATTVGAGKFF